MKVMSVIVVYGCVGLRNRRLTMHEVYINLIDINGLKFHT